LKKCRSIIKKALEGFHGTILCYGQTTSGKTYTTLGELPNPGIIPCTLRDLFNYAKSDQKISVSYV